MADTLKDKSIQLSHGGGGKEMNKLIRDLFLPSLITQSFSSEEDAAKLDLHGANAFLLTLLPSPFFAGGDIGKLPPSQAQSTISL